MTADQVQVGQTYAVKVSGKIQPVRITGTSSFGGWDGENINTKRSIRIRSARKLRKHMTGVGRCRACENCKAVTAEKPNAEAKVFGLTLESPRRIQGINEWREFCAAHLCNGGVS